MASLHLQITPASRPSCGSLRSRSARTCPWSKCGESSFSPAPCELTSSKNSQSQRTAGAAGCAAAKNLGWLGQTAKFAKGAFCVSLPLRSGAAFGSIGLTAALRRRSAERPAQACPRPTVIGSSQPKHDIHAGRSAGTAAGANSFPRADVRVRSASQGDAAISVDVSEAQKASFAKSVSAVCLWTRAAHSRRSEVS